MTTERITKGPESGAPGGQAFAAVLRDCVSCGLLLVGPGDAVELLNPQAAEVLELPEQERCALSNLPQAVRSVVSKVLETHLAAQLITVLQVGSERLQVALWAAPVGHADGVVVVALNRFLPVGPLEPDLQRLDRLVSTGILSAGLAHEVKNALVPVQTFTDLLLEKHPDAELAEIVRRELARADSIVGRLLKYARPSSGSSASVHLHDTLDYALRLVQHHFQPGFIALQRTFAASLDTVRGDEAQLHQAFVNILMNGIEAMGPTGTLTVATANSAGEGGGRAARLLRVTIADTGPGISTENLARLFEPFFTTKSNGTGLGLAVARRIFAEHQGTISVECRPGQGAAFIVTLPAYEGENPSRQPAGVTGTLHAQPRP